MRMAASSLQRGNNAKCFRTNQQVEVQKGRPGTDQLSRSHVTNGPAISTCGEYGFFIPGSFKCKLTGKMLDLY